MIQIAKLLSERRKEIGAAWLKAIVDISKNESGSTRTTNMLKAEATEFLRVFLDFLEVAGYDITSSHFVPVSELTARISANHAREGLNPSETAMFVMSLKDVLLPIIVEASGKTAKTFAQELTGINHVIDHLSLETFAAFVRTREDTILRQSRAILDLSTPILQVWPEILLMPLIGVIDTLRAQQVMEQLLTAIVETRSLVAILDVTGVPVIDTRVALHLTKVIGASRMLGAKVVLTGISPDAAQTLVKLDVDFSNISTRGTLRAGLAEALRIIGKSIGQNV